MPLTNTFYEAVQSGDVRSVRIMMKNSLLVDTTFTEFNAMEKAASSMKALYDEHDGKEMNLDKTEWNDEYLSKVMARVLSNFSHERLEHLKDVVRFLNPAPVRVAPQKQENRSSHNNRSHATSYEEEKRRCQERGDYLGAKIGAGAVVGAAVSGVIVSVAGAPVAGVIGGVVAGAVVGGAATTLIVNGGKK